MVEIVPNHVFISPTISELKWDLEVSDRLLQVQIATKKHLEVNFKQDIQEIRIGFKTLGIVWNQQVLLEKVNDCIEQMEENQISPLSQKTWEIPVCYEEEFAKDLIPLAESKGLSPEEVINLHSKRPYRIHFFGFLPGFMYLQGLPEILHSARKPIPDRSIPAGSVAIGGSQTGIYPANSPGGWHLIGRSPIFFFDPKKQPPVWAEAGDRVQFSPISKEEYLVMKETTVYPTWR